MKARWDSPADGLAIEVSAPGKRPWGCRTTCGSALANAIGEAFQAALGERLPEVSVWRRSKWRRAAIVRFADKPAKALGYALPPEVCEWLDWPRGLPAPAIRFRLGEALPGDHPLVQWLIYARALDECEIGAAKEGAAR